MVVTNSKKNGHAHAKQPDDPIHWTSERFDRDMSQGSCSTAISNHTAHQWRIERAVENGFAGSSRCRSVLDARIVAFEGQAGVRCLHDSNAVRQTTREDLSIIFAADGDMVLDIAGRSVALRAGMFTITDSSQPMVLDIPSSFRHMYYIFPKDRVLSVFPFAQDFVGVPFGSDEGLMPLFVDYLGLAERHLCMFDDEYADSVLNITLDLLAQALGSTGAKRMVTPRQRQLARIKSYIERRLSDTDLDLPSIAADNGINKRYLHKIFAETDTSVSTWVRQRRLAMCQRDLNAPALAQRNITEIAFRWGFNDMSHFSKAFKREFGMGPREYRIHSNH